MVLYCITIKSNLSPLPQKSRYYLLLSEFGKQFYSSLFYQKLQKSNNIPKTIIYNVLHILNWLLLFTINSGRDAYIKTDLIIDRTENGGGDSKQTYHWTKTLLISIIGIDWPKYENNGMGRDA